MLGILDAIEQAIIKSQVGSVQRAGQIIAASARAKAPVRKIFTGDHRIISVRSVEESFLASADRVRGYVSNEVVRGYNVRYPHRISLRALQTQDLPGYLSDEAEALLTRRGRYEVRSTRARFRPQHRAAQIGGRLKGEIHVTEARLDGRNAEVEVVSPTSYAKFQEFGTRHNRAHPYLRPARDENEREFRAIVGERAAVAGKAAIRATKARPKTIRLTVTKG